MKDVFLSFVSKVCLVFSGWFEVDEQDHTADGLIPWERVSRERLTPFSPYGDAPEIISKLRTKDTYQRAPFSDRTMIVGNLAVPHSFQLPPGFSPHSSEPERLQDVPVNKIIGIGRFGPAACEFTAGMTFREVLFECLHGQGVTDESIAFLLSDADKSLPMPHTPFGNAEETRAKGGISLARYGQWYIVETGQHRAIIAMYAIWQEFGDQGVLKNVPVSG